MKNKIKKSFNKFVDNFKNKTIDTLFIVILYMYIIGFSVYGYRYANYLLNLPSILFIISVWYLLYRLLIKIKSEKKLSITIFLISLLIYSIWGFLAETQPVSDYEALIEGAKQMLNNNFSSLSFDKTNYFYFYNFQIGYATYLFIIMKLLGNKLITLKIVEIIILSLSNILVYKIGKNIYTRKEGILASIIYLSLFFNIAGSSIINNQHISSFFALISIYLFTKKLNFKNSIIIGTLLGISIILRQSVIILLIAMILYIFWYCFKDNFKTFKTSAICLILIFSFCTAMIKIYDFSMIKLNITPNAVSKSNLKYFKYVLGIQDYGIYNTYTKDQYKTQVYYDLEKVNFDYDKYNNESKKYLIDKYKNYDKNMFNKLQEKMLLFTAAPDNQIYFSGQINNTPIGQLFISLGHNQYQLLIILVLLSTITLFGKYKNNNKNYRDLFSIAFIGYFLVHVLIEVQPRYRYDQYIYIVLLATPFLYKIIKKVEKRGKNE